MARALCGSGPGGPAQDAPGRGRKPIYPPEIVVMLVRRTTRQKLEAATHWRRRVMARATELSASTISRIWHHYDHPLGRAQCRRRHGDRAVPGASPPYRVAEVSAVAP